MMRYLKILFLSMAVIGLMAGAAFAGTTRLNHTAANTAITVSLEAMGAARNVTILGAGLTAGTAPITFELGQSLISGNLIEVVFTGAAFGGDLVNVCALNGAGVTGIVLATATPAAGTTTQNFQTSFPTLSAANVAAGNFIWLTNGTQADCEGLAVGARNMIPRISSTTSATIPTARIRNLTSGGIEVDSSAAVNLAIVRGEFAVTNQSTGHIIDYLATPGNGTRLLNVFGGAPTLTADSWASAGAQNTVAITQTVNNYSLNSGGANAGLTVGAVVGLSDSANWQGVSRAYLVRGAGFTNCATANAVATANSPTGVVSLSLPAAAFNGSATNSFNACIEANGTDSLQARTIQANVDISVSTGGNDPAASAYASGQVWVLNAYQAFIPWMVNASTVPTYCLINSAETTRTANVILDVLSSEGAVTILNQSLGSIAPQTSILGIFTANSVTLGSGTPVSLTTLGTDRRYASRITVAANPNNISIACIQTDPISGAKRAVPVLSNSFWTQ